MIYLVSLQSELFDNNSYKVVTIEESLNLLSPFNTLGLDTETAGLDPYIDELLLVQIGNRELQVVIDCRTIDINLYKEFHIVTKLYFLIDFKSSLIELILVPMF